MSQLAGQIAKILVESWSRNSKFSKSAYVSVVVLLQATLTQLSVRKSVHVQWSFSVTISKTEAFNSLLKTIYDVKTG
jgi:isoprenylcysteine carboxyl methyltransferase (ICMT) family protein YpbQ